MKPLRVTLFFPALCAAVWVRAEVVPVDVGAWVGVEGMTNGWTVSGIDTYSDGSVHLGEKDDFALSPVFPGVVTQLVMTVKASSASATRFLTAHPVVAKDGAGDLAATADGKFTEQTHVWRAGEGVRRFRLGLTGSGSNAWGIRTLAVWLDDRVVPPLDLSEEDAHSDALTVCWTAETRASAYEVEPFRLAVAPPVKVWNFTSLTNASGKTRDFRELKPEGELDDVGGTGLCLQGKEGGYLQIGNTERGGEMILPLPSATNWVVRANMFRLATDGDVVAYPGYVASDGATNALAGVHLATNSLACTFSLPPEANLFLLASSKGDDRIRVESVSLSPGSPVTNALPLVRTARIRKTLRNLSPGDFLWRVRSCGPDGSRSDWSTLRAVRLHPDAPPFGRRGWVLRLSR